jgi:cobalt-zinc-cadmium resistance protein CzcA
MARRLFEAALSNRLMTIILIVIFVALGVRAMVALPIDASPDVTPNVVTIVTEAPGLGPAEVEKLITFPVEVTMRGLKGSRKSARSRGSASPRSRSISRSSSTSISLVAL